MSWDSSISLLFFLILIYMEAMKDAFKLFNKEYTGFVKDSPEIDRRGVRREIIHLRFGVDLAAGIRSEFIY